MPTRPAGDRFQDTGQLHDDPVEDVQLDAQGKARGTDGRLLEDRKVTAERATTTHSGRRSQARVRRRLVKVLRRRRIARAAALDVLVAEDLHIGAGRDPAMATHGETLIRAVGEAAADRRMARSQRGLDRAGRIDQLQARQAKLRIRAGQGYNGLARHADGGHQTVVELRDLQEGLRAQIDSEIAQGSRKHQRLPRWIRQLPKLVLAADFCLLLYFFSGITNVNWARPLSADLTFAVLLATVVTTLSYGFLGFTGYRLRIHKITGTIHREDLEGLTRTAAAAAVVGSVFIAALIFIRMRTEVLSALGPRGWVTALVIALVLAAVSLLGNFLVVGIRALDGSRVDSPPGGALRGHRRSAVPGAPEKREIRPPRAPRRGSAWRRVAPRAGPGGDRSRISPGLGRAGHHGGARGSPGRRRSTAARCLTRAVTIVKPVTAISTLP